MADSLPVEKRENVRAVISASVRIRPVERVDTEKESSHLADLPENRNGASVKTPVTDAAVDGLTNLLLSIDEKLDRILAKMEDDNQDSPGGYDVKQVRDLSGSGISIRLDYPVYVGQLFLMTLKIPGFSLGGLDVYGEVIWVRSLESDGEQLYEAGINFVDISENDRERLISFTFSQQRRHIRNGTG